MTVETMRKVEKKILFILVILALICDGIDGGLLKIPKIKLKPLINAATDIASELADFTLNEILNFRKFKNVFNKVYASVDLENQALLNFLTMQRSVERHNERFHRGEVSFLRALCELSDMTPDEVNEKMNRFVKPGEKPELKAREDVEEVEEAEEEEEITNEPTRKKRSEEAEESAEYLNYTAEGFVNPVVSQGLCGSCWSFAAAAAIEAQWFKQTGELVKLSEQQLIDCNRDDEGDGNYGCAGGNMAVAFEFIKGFGAVALSSDYPYEANDTFECKKVSDDAEITVVSHKVIDPGDEELLKKALEKHGPIAIAVDASLPSFQSYKSGVYFDPECTEEVNHAVLLVGYGVDEESGEKYWLIKNTYGKSWGLQGYMMMARDRDNHCGVTNYAAYPVL